MSIALANAAEVSVGERAVSQLIQMRIILALSEQIKVHAVLSSSLSLRLSYAWELLELTS